MTAVTLVFLHEGLGSAELWRDVPQVIADAVGGARLVVESRGGYGHAPAVSLPRPVSYMHDEADLLGRRLDELGVEQPVLIGHSDGASIALIAAGRGLPVEALVLIAPHVFVEERGLDGIRAARAEYENGNLRLRLARYHDHVDVAFRGWNDVWLSPEFRSWDITSLLGGIGAPILLVQSAGDPYGSLAQLDAIEAGVRGSVERLVLAGTSHAPHVTDPDVVLPAVTNFLIALRGTV